ncbi:asparagine synthase-related protein [Streptosporangium lutulentum]
MTSAVWRGPDVVLLAWSNEGDAHRDPGLLIEANGHAVGVNGYLADPADGARLLAGEHADTLGGCFAVFRAGAGELSAMTTVTRACPVFYAENDEVHVVGSRALQVRLATRGGVRWNAPGLQSMIRQGYFLSDETPFDGVSALPPSSELLVRDGSRVIRTEALPRAEAVPEGARLKRAGVETLASALLAAVEPVRNATEPVNLALTGGRDSRLMAALLHAARIPFRATTNGLDDHPDVIIARRIARSLRIEHTVIAPKRTERKDAILVDHPLVRTLETLRTCEGMTSAYESIVGYLPYSPKPTMNGQSGEILRGGFLYSQGNLAPKALARRVDAFFSRTARCSPTRPTRTPGNWRLRGRRWTTARHSTTCTSRTGWGAGTRAPGPARSVAVTPCSRSSTTGWSGWHWGSIRCGGTRRRSFTTSSACSPPSCAGFRSKAAPGGSGRTSRPPSRSASG